MINGTKSLYRVPMISIISVRCCTRRLYSTENKVLGVSSAEVWKRAVRSNPLLSELHKLQREGRLQVRPHDDIRTENTLNASSTLPITVLPKVEIEDAVKSDPSIGKWRKPAVKWFRIGRFLLTTYKSGIKNTWKTYFETKKSTYSARDFMKLIEFKETESRILKHDRLHEVSITRKEYLKWLRRQEFWKIPKFLIAFLLFEEATPLVAYLFPSLCPWNCLTPGVYKKISDSRTSKLSPDFSMEKKYIAPYDLDKNNVSKFLISQSVIPGWKMMVYKLTDEYRLPLLSVVEMNQRILVDDWLLLRELVKNNGEVITLCDRELVDAILRRQLYTIEEDLNHMIQHKQGQLVLTYRLLIYLAFRFDDTISAGNLNGKLFAEKWGVDNLAVFNFCGSDQLLREEHLKNISE